MVADPYICVIGAASVDLAGHSHCAIVAEESNPGSLHVSWGTGAGDAMMAGLVAGCLRGLSLEQAAHQAMAAALITLQHRDAVNPNMSKAALQDLRDKIQHA